MSFYDFCIGKTNIYGRDGAMVKTINCDENYNFSIDSLIEKIRKEFKIDFSTREGNWKSVRREFVDGKYCYVLQIWLSSNAKGPVKKIIVDGNTGKVLSQSSQNYNQEHDPRI